MDNRQIIFKNHPVKSSEKLMRDFPDQVCYTNDKLTAQLVFEISDCTEAELAGLTASIMIFMRDGSFFQDSAVIDAPNKKITYVMLENQVAHAGDARASLVLTGGSQGWGGPDRNFTVISDLGQRVATEVMIKDWTMLTAEARAYLDEFAANEVTRQQTASAAESARAQTFTNNEAGRQSTFEMNEATRQTKETERQASETIRKSAETGRVNAESSRVTAEQGRTTAEQGRVSAESARVTAEQGRAAALAAKADKTYVDAQLADIASGSGIDEGAISLEKTDNNLQSLLFVTKGTRNAIGKIVRLYDYIPLSAIEYNASVDSTKIIALGKNLLNQNEITGFNGGVVVTKSEGRIDIVNNNSYVASSKLPLYLKPGTYTISALEHNAMQISLYRNGAYAAGLLPGLNKSATFTVPDEAYPYEMKINAPASGGTAFAKELMVEYGTLKTDYVSYKAPVEYASGLPVTADDTLMTDGTEIDVTYRTNKLKFADNPLYGKKAVYNGDSICAASVGGVIGYPALIAQSNGMDMINYGVDGGTIAYYAGKHCISRTVANMSADADYIIFEGGINDYWLNIPLGTVSTGYSATLNDTTFCGAFEQMLKNAILKWQGKKIGYILIHKVNGTTPQAYWDKAKEICKKWSIPLLDLYDNSGIVYDLEAIRTTYSNNADGCHPNLGGYEILAPKIEAWMKTL